MAQPFSRAIAMFALIRAAMAGPNAQVALAGIGPYRSRGKGLGLPGNKHSAHCVAMDKRAAAKARNRKEARRHV